MKKDISGWDVRIDDDTIARYTRTGQWRNTTLLDGAQHYAKACPEATAVIDDDGQLTYLQALDQAFRLADRLRSRGVKPGHVVSFQLPNWHEAVIINLACAIGGFVCNPIIPIYREVEVGYILRQSHTRVLFIPEQFRSLNYISMIEGLRADLPELVDVVLVRSQRGGYPAYADWITGRGAIADFPPVDPNAVKMLLYTSGTTGNPKGVLHSHNTLRAELDTAFAFWSLSRDDVMLMPSPVTHITGYLYGLELPFVCGIKVVLMARWNAAEAVQSIERHGASLSIGATPFLVELVSEVERQSKRLSTFRLFGSGGAPVPPEVVKRATQVLPNCRTFRVYGSSEAPTVSLGVAPGDPSELGAVTDGFIINHEVRIIDPATGQLMPDGQPGEVVTRGPEVMLAYTDPEHTREAFDADGYFHSGDLGYRDYKGYITITGRIKDLIIRGGENISPKEIEDLVHQHPAVQEASVVAMPHDRMGETPCAYVILRPGHTLDFQELIAFLDKAGLARQKFPERLFLVDSLPRTASGKVLKHVLRSRAPQDAAVEPAAH